MRKVLIFLVVVGSCLDSRGQTEVDSILAKSLASIYDRQPARINLVFHQPAYAPGDTAFFQVSYLNAETLKPLRGKQLLNLVVNDATGVSIARQSFIVLDGLASNQIILPADVPPGLYRLVCWSNVMRNYDHSLFYQQPLEIVGEKKIVSGGGILSLAPEGGSLVEQIDNKIFAYVYPPQQTSCTVFERGQAITEFTINANGVGFFHLTPAADKEYSVWLKGKSMPVPLPKAQPRGCSMATRTSPSGLEVNGKVQSAGGTSVFLLLVKGRKVLFSKKVIPEANQFSVTIPQKTIPQGLYQLLVFNEGKSLLASRLLFNHIQSHDWISLTHPSTVGTRSPMEIILQSDANKQGTYSVSVYQTALFNKRADNGSVASLELFSHLENTMYSAGRSIPLDSINRLNDFLATQQWKASSLDSAAMGVTGKINFLPESSVSIKGRVFNKTTGEALPSPTFITFYLENSTLVQGTYADRNGRFKMDLPGSIRIKEKAYYKVDFNEQELTDAWMEIQEEGQSLPADKSEKKEEFDPYFSYNALRRAAETSFNHAAVDLGRLGVKKNPNWLLEEETMGVDVEYKMADYKVFNSMEEVAIEILPRVVYSKPKGKVSIRMNVEEWGETKHELSKGSPIYVIDGVMTNDSEFFLSLNPADLDKIKLLWSVEKRRVLGALGSNGVVLIETKNPAIASRIPTSHSLNLAGISEPIPFVQKVAGKDPRKPFLKPVLFWNPNLDFDAEGKRRISFSTSDDLGEYTIEVTGIDENGKPFFRRSAFTVTPGNGH